VVERLLSANEAAERLGITKTSLYAWLAQSDAGNLVIRGVPFTIDYLQGGAKGQGRIKIESREVQRIREAMRVRPRPDRPRRPPRRRQTFPGITVKLGRPDQ
jgi:hypothetical protein